MSGGYSAFIPRTLAQPDGTPGHAALVRALIVGALLALALFVILAAPIMPGQLSLKVGDVAVDDIRAPRSVSFVSVSQTAAARTAAAAAVPSEYAPIAPIADIKTRQLAAYDAQVSDVSSVLTRRDAGDLMPGESAADTLRRTVADLTVSQAEQLAVMPLKEWQAVAEAGRTVLEAVYASPVKEDDLSNVRQQVRNNITEDLQQQDRELAGDLAAGKVAPTMQVSEAATKEARDAAAAGVTPVSVDVAAGEVVVRDGARVTTEQLEALSALGLTTSGANAPVNAGNALIAMVMAGLLVSFLWRFEPEVWYRNRSLLLFVLALVVTGVALRIAADRSLWAFVVPASASILLIGLLLGGPAGAAVAVALSVLAGVMNQNALEPAVYVLAGGVVSLLATVRAERLNAFVRAGLLLALANIAVIVAFGLLEQRDVAALLQGMGAGAVNAGLAVVLAVGSFAMLGNLFGIMTVFQLLELANPSSRLLRRLLLETPGTYHHSVMVGNLAERAAETIGANPLLARVAAYYHDIGKMKNPLAFIENQAGAHNIHDDLTADTSARIISSHIRDGIDLAYEHGLPVKIIGFIPQHHGTSVMSYFYGKALREVGGREDLVDRDLYRYPGPKPQSPEAAILMLSDGVEASVRSLDEKDEASIRAMVDRIVDARVEDGQLDDADLTLKNISQIKEAFVQQLLGMYHQRIKYPDNVVPLERREQA
jgi:putative nucleotidyltransferase with HDIG domain